MWKRRKDANDKHTHKEEAGLECRFIDGVVAVEEGAVLGIEAAVGVEDTQQYPLVWMSSWSKPAAKNIEDRKSQSGEKCA